MPHRALNTPTLLLSPRASVAPSTREELYRDSGVADSWWTASCKLKEGFGGFN
jgi:hypothetical protein